MDGMIYCLVDAGGKVYVKDGADSHADVAAAFGLDEASCDQYRFDLTTRQLVRDRGNPASDRAIHRFVDRSVGTPEQLIEFAQQGHLSKLVLARLLAAEKKQPYLEACAVIEKQYTDDCFATNDPCLEGCAMSEDEVCLQPLLRAEVDYHKACAAEWVRFFADLRNRAAAWQN